MLFFTWYGDEADEKGLAKSNDDADWLLGGLKIDEVVLNKSIWD